MLAAMGLKLPAGSSVKYNAGNSTLFFHGTPRDLNFLEELVAAKVGSAPASNCSATFLEVNQADLEELGFNWIVNLNLDPQQMVHGRGRDE